MYETFVLILDQIIIMSKQKPSIPKGTRDFGPEQMNNRNFIFSTIKKTFESFGFSPLETPSMENLDVLTGKYGDEGDQLIFKILNSGDYLSKTNLEEFNKGSKSFTREVSEKALRYDLTVPFARYVVMNHGSLTLPFKRYQIQPVWRADRPQRGRYREFFQCDADVVGTKSLLCESEIILMIKKALTTLGINDFTIKINNRKILSALAQLVGGKSIETDLFVAIDKLDKIGLDKVLLELDNKGFDENMKATVSSYLQVSGTIEKVVSELNTLFKDIEIGIEGIKELQEVFELTKNYNNNLESIELDPTLARGLSYYTGTIFEVKVNNVKMGSISGGGRYDNLTGVFGLEGVPGVGFSFGVDRIYDVMNELKLFPEGNSSNTDVLFANFSSEDLPFALKAASILREHDINVEVYPDSVKMKKQFSYADKKNIPFVVMIGTDEVAANTITLKNLLNGNQESLAIEDAILKIKEHLAN